MSTRARRKNRLDRGKFVSEGLIVICLSAAAGIVGTGLGGALGALLGGGGERTAAGAMGFASGIMIGLSAFEMLPSAAGALSGVMGETPAVFAAAAIALIGAALVMLAERALDRASAGRGEGNGGQGGGRLTRAGIAAAIVIALHNLPEGVAIGGTGAAELSGGITVALMIALHDVPEGMAIGAPLAGGGVSAGRAILAAAASGITTVIGAAIGLAAGSVAWAGAVAVAAAAGSMLAATFSSLLPETYALSDSRPPVFAVLLGIAAALCFSLV